jgi:hypothetical protein
MRIAAAIPTAMAIWGTSAAFAQVREHVEYVADIDRWRVEVYSGALNPGGLLQGPRLQAGHERRGPMAFLPSGDACTAGEGVVFVFTREGAVRYLAGDPDQPGYRDGPAAEALLGRDLTVAAGPQGDLFIADRSNRCVRRAVKTNGMWQIETLAGHPDNPANRDLLKAVRDESSLQGGARKERFASDGVGRQATFHYMHSNVIVDAAGNAYVIDADFLRRISPDGRVETLNPHGGTGPPANADGEPLRSARFRLLMQASICFDKDQNIFVADRWNHCVRKIDLARGVVTVAAGPGRGYVDGPAREAGFHDSPGHIAYDPYRGRVYVTGVDDWGLRTFEDGRMKTIAGGQRSNQATEGPAKEAGIHWGGVRGVDPGSPHDIYFWSGAAQWRGRIGRLFRAAPAREEQP